MICQHDTHCLSTKEVIFLTLILTFALYASGLFTVNYVSQFEPWLQNIIYAVGRIPFLFGILYYALKKEQP